ncbi:hypothetical protein BT63DRAFT_479717 [Microthyrium microscopicum]|uniref:Uncharacterized protein n=1 Tax=Microthyrium microscopicum TaxID=703497 RepID=A0A6A6U7Q8_9PEZI|nr:hypothetical protein BT63DRAFT_479717 [Microthyrium microscopicum]
MSRTRIRPFSLYRQWTCQSCQHQLLRAPRSFTTTARLRPASEYPSPARFQDAREYYKYRNRSIGYYTLSLLIGVVACSYGSVPLYKTICQQMGWGGQPIKSKSHFGPETTDPASRLIPSVHAHRIRITFSGSTSSILPWSFTPQQREVRVLPGETALAFYTATNHSKEDIIGVATYSVTPDKVAPYFSKIQCFCFEEQRLNAGESVDMPVFFYIDPDFALDPNVRKIETVTLHYTFFKAKYDKAGHLNPVSMKI